MQACEPSLISFLVFTYFFPLSLVIFFVGFLVSQWMVFEFEIFSMSSVAFTTHYLHLLCAVCVCRIVFWRSGHFASITAKSLKTHSSSFIQPNASSHIATLSTVWAEVRQIHNEGKTQKNQTHFYVHTFLYIFCRSFFHTFFSFTLFPCCVFTGFLSAFFFSAAPSIN